MKKYSSILFVIIALLGTSCASVTNDIKITAEADPKANLAGYKTFSWYASAEILHDPKGQWEPTALDIDSEVEWLIGRELREKGMSQVGDGADIMVAYVAGVDMAAKKLVEDEASKLEIMKNVPKAALMVVLMDASTGNPVWAGVAKAEVQMKASESTVKKRLDYAITNMFKKYKN